MILYVKTWYDMLWYHIIIIVLHYTSDRGGRSRRALVLSTKHRSAPKERCPSCLSLWGPLGDAPPIRNNVMIPGILLSPQGDKHEGHLGQRSLLRLPDACCTQRDMPGRVGPGRTALQRAVLGWTPMSCASVCCQRLMIKIRLLITNIIWYILIGCFALFFISVIYRS